MQACCKRGGRGTPPNPPRFWQKRRRRQAAAARCINTYPPRFSDLATSLQSLQGLQSNPGIFAPFFWKKKISIFDAIELASLKVYSFLKLCFAISLLNTIWWYFQLIFKLTSAGISWKYSLLHSSDFSWGPYPFPDWPAVYYKKSFFFLNCRFKGLRLV